MTDEKKETPVIAYKGFDKDMKCRGFQYEIGETYTHEGDVEACSSGFHSCEYPLDVFSYYPPAESMFAVVEADGNQDRHKGDSKIASEKITIKAALDLPGLIKAAIKYTTERVKPSDDGAASNSGDYGAASNSGDYGAASNSGYQGAASNSGYQGAASNSGVQGAASNSGVQGAASNSGVQGAASNSGDYGAASNSGDYGAASNSGYQGAASNSGVQGAASNSGVQGAASNSGEHGVAASFGYQGRAKSDTSGAIVLCHRNNDGEIVHIRASKVGENGIKPDTWYELDADGEFVEVES